MTIRKTTADPATNVDSPARGEVSAAAARRRLGAWVIIVVLALAACAWPLLVQSHTGALLAAAQSIAALTGMLALLLTTPSNAIRLRWPTSAAIIGAGAVALPLVASAGNEVIGTLFAGFCALLVLGILLTPNAPLSAWWGVLLLWHPGLWLLWEPMTGGASMLIAGGSRAGVLLAIIVIYGVYNDWPRRFVWSAWAISGVLVGVSLFGV
ncbi:MAG: hypothetical protein AAFX05_09435 [Planctomycetota bacterium]